RRYAAELGADLRFEKTTDRAAALREAHFVINTALVGGHDHEEAERALWERHGYYRGAHHAECFRQLDLMLSVARDMERFCPNAWLIQSSNPVFEGCTLMTRETGIKVLGLCHGHYGYREIARVLGLELEHVTFEAPGFNHCIWMTHFRYKGEDAYPLLDQWIENEAEAYWRTWQPRYHETQMSPAAIHMYKFYGLMPIGDTSRALWSEVWWYHLDLETKKRWWGPLGGFDSAEGWEQYLDSLNHNLQRIREAIADPRRRVTEVIPPKKSDEQIVPIIDALVNDHQGYFQVNVPNHGALEGIPDDVVVEVPALVDGRGIRPLAVGRLPERIMLGVMWPRWLEMERHLAAYLTGDPQYLMQNLLADHRTQTWEQAEEALEAIARMPGNEPMARHYGFAS
ncbi:MAG TPA: alpha-glucosidase/alpha-galactosidase, partial [Caldilineae bacterium]|nr:alpha-glucosidase/alpha-galactosidase [Caldilineae bacterium]